MKRHLLNLLTVLSLLLCLAAAALWARSYFREDRVLWTPVDRGPRRITSVPLWAPVLAGAALPVVRLWRRRRGERLRRVANRLCFRCGYDLRASPERCPECGSMAPVLPAR